MKKKKETGTIQFHEYYWDSFDDMENDTNKVSEPCDSFC